MHYICIIYVKKVEISDYIYKSNSILKLKGDVKEVFDKTFMKKKKNSSSSFSLCHFTVSV